MHPQQLITKLVTTDNLLKQLIYITYISKLYVVT